MKKRLTALLMAVAMAVLLPATAALAADDTQRDGTAISINVVTDGAEREDFSEILTVEPLGNGSFDAGSGRVNFKFSRYDCRDILFTAADGYAIEGICATLVYGLDGSRGIVSSGGGMLADNVKGGSTVTVYLRSVYRVVYHDENGAVLGENTAEAIAAGRTPLAISNRPMTEEQLREPDADGSQEGHEYCYSALDLNTCEIIAAIPEDRAGYVYDGWYVGAPGGETKLSPGTVFYGAAYSFELLDGCDGEADRVINLYRTGAPVYTVTVRYENEEGETLREPSEKTVAAGSRYDVFNGTDLPVGLSHNGIFYVFDGLKEGAAAEKIADGDDEVTFVYAADAMGGADGGPDGIADKYQAFIIYRANDNSLGTVSVPGEAIDLREDIGAGLSLENVSVSGSTAGAKPGARFTGWTLNGREAGSGPVLEYTFDTVIPGAVYTFVANFSA